MHIPHPDVKRFLAFTGSEAALAELAGSLTCPTFHVTCLFDAQNKPFRVNLYNFETAFNLDLNPDGSLAEPFGCDGSIRLVWRNLPNDAASYV